MSAKPTIQTQCPMCRKKYEVPAVSVGHRARCTGCKAVFKVTERYRHPTEDDILRWLSEVEDPDFVDPPVVIGRRTESSDVSVAEQAPPAATPISSDAAPQRKAQVRVLETAGPSRQAM